LKLGLQMIEAFVIFRPTDSLLFDGILTSGFNPLTA